MVHGFSKLRLYLRQISQSFQESLESILAQSVPLDPRGHPASTETSVKEKMGLWQTEGSGNPDVAVEWPEDLADDQDDSDDNQVPYLPEARAFVTESKAYSQMIEKLRSVLKLSPRKGSAIEKVHNHILEALASLHKQNIAPVANASHCWFNIEWEPVSFLTEQYPFHTTRIEDVISLTGSDPNAQAATCAQYMRQTWPITGSENLRALSTAIELARLKQSDGASDCIMKPSTHTYPDPLTDFRCGSSYWDESSILASSTLLVWLRRCDRCNWTRSPPC